MNSLEVRLAETEAALYAALTTIVSLHNNDASLSRHVMSVPDPQMRERSKNDKQDEWKRLPLRSGEQIQIWFEEKSQLDYHRQPLPAAHTPYERHIQIAHSTEASNEAATAGEVCAEHVSLNHVDIANTTTDMSRSTRFQDSAHWRNYF